MVKERYRGYTRVRSLRQLTLGGFHTEQAVVPISTADKLRAHR